jgi:hypothetical protein
VKPVKQDFAVLFVGFRKWNPQMRKFLGEVDDTIEKLHNEGGNRTVLSLFPINMLCGELCTQCKMVVHHASPMLCLIGLPTYLSICALYSYMVAPCSLAAFLGSLDPESEGMTVLQNVTNHLLKDMVSHPRRPKCSATSL